MVDTSYSAPISVSFWSRPKAGYKYDSSCVNKPIYFTNLSSSNGSGRVRYYWQIDQGTVDSTADITHLFSSPGIYSIRLVVAPDICPSISDTLVRSINIKGPDANLQYEVLKVVKNKPVNLNARNIGQHYQWSPSSGLSSISSRNPILLTAQEQVYTVQVRDTSGCVTVDTQQVLLFEEKEIYVPKGFTPNNDGQNDRLYPILVDIVKLNYFRVYNRWGKLLFETVNPDPTKGWDGISNGVKQPADSYTWVSEGLDADGKIVRKNGTVVLIR